MIMAPEIGILAIFDRSVAFFPPKALPGPKKYVE